MAGEAGAIGAGRRRRAEPRTGRGGAAGRNHYWIALGSAAEACAALDLLGSVAAPEQQQKLRRVGAMLRKLAG